MSKQIEFKVRWDGPAEEGVTECPHNGCGHPIRHRRLNVLKRNARSHAFACHPGVTSVKFENI